MNSISISATRRGKGAGKRSRSDASLPQNANISRIVLKHEDGSMPTVMVRGQSFRAMGLQHQHIDAAERFSKDWEAAYGKLRCRGFEPGVDGGKAHRGHLATVEAQRRVHDAKIALGDRDFVIVVAVVVHGASARRIERGPGKGRHAQALRNDIEAAFSELASFYSGAPRIRDQNWIAFEKFIEASELGNHEEAARVWDQRFPGGRSAKRTPAAVRKKTDVADQPGPARLARNAVNSAIDWAKLEKKRISEFSIAAAGKKSRELTVYCVSEDGSGPTSRSIVVSGPYLLEAIDAQLVKAAEANGWLERNTQGPD